MTWEQTCFKTVIFWNWVPCFPFEWVINGKSVIHRSTPIGYPRIVKRGIISLYKLHVAMHILHSVTFHCSWLCPHVSSEVGKLLLTHPPTLKINCNNETIMIRVLQAGKWHFERGRKRSKMTFLGLKMIIFGHFSPFFPSFKIHFPACSTLIMIDISKLTMTLVASDMNSNDNNQFADLFMFLK